MPASNPDVNSTHRRIRIALLTVGALLQLIRILNVHSSTGETPFLSANDRSRWCTVLALSITGDYAIDKVIEIRDPQTRRRTWYTIDMVQHRGRDGRQHFYSSKPPLLPTLYAGAYWVVKNVSGATLTGQPFLAARLVLLLVSFLPLLWLWWLLTGWAERYVASTPMFALCCVFAVFGTFLSTFSVTLNNHLPAALATAISWSLVERIGLRNDRRSRWFWLAGLATSFAAANELPATGWVVGVGALLWWVDWRKTATCYVPSLLPITLAFFATNYLAHGTLRPAYTQRAVGAKIATVETAVPSDLQLLDLAPVLQKLRPLGFELSDDTILRRGRRPDVWELWDEASQWRIALKSPSPDRLELYQWGDWYDYPNSYWQEGRKKGVDVGEPNAAKYALHCLIGHHGILSLTPFWLVSFVGLAAIWMLPRSQPILKDVLRLLSLLIVVTTVVVIGFYLLRPLEDRNYGGVCSGLRWSFWLIPLWYWLAVHGAARMQAGWQQCLVLLLLVGSLYSALEPWNNPWVNPWLYRLDLHQAPENASSVAP